MTTSTNAMTRALLLGTLLQVGMVVIGHNTVAVASLFAPLGMAISLIAGLLYARTGAIGGLIVHAVGGRAPAGARIKMRLPGPAILAGASHRAPRSGRALET